MDIKTRHRVIGVVVLIALAVIAVPLFFARSEPADKTLALSSQVPAPPNEALVPLTIPPSPESRGQATRIDLATRALQPAGASEDNAATMVAAQAIPEEASAAPAAEAATSSSADNTSAVEKNADNVTEVNLPQEPKRNKAGKIKIELAEKAPVSTHRPSRQITIEKIKPASMSIAWTIQLGSFAQKNNATQLVKRLREKGYAAYIHHTGDMSQVFVGPELQRGKAETLAKKLQEEFRLRGVIIKYKV